MADATTTGVPTDLEDAELTLASYVRASATKRRLLIEQVQSSRRVYGFRPCWPANSEMAVRAMEQDLKDTLAKAVDMVAYLAELDPGYVDADG